MDELHRFAGKKWRSSAPQQRLDPAQKFRIVGCAVFPRGQRAGQFIGLRAQLQARFDAAIDDAVGGIPRLLGADVFVHDVNGSYALA